MPISDKKKCTAFINYCAEAVDDLKIIAARLEGARALFIAQGVDATGTPPDGHEALVSTWIDAVRADADSPVAKGLLAHRVPSHGTRALETE